MILCKACGLEFTPVVGSQICVACSLNSLQAHLSTNMPEVYLDVSKRSSAADKVAHLNAAIMELKQACIDRDIEVDSFFDEMRCADSDLQRQIEELDERVKSLE